MISVESVGKSFRDTTVLADLTLRVAPRESVSLIGPSGCGKTTLLNILSGIETADRGAVRIDGAPHSQVGYMMQDSSLLPWRTLGQNATLGIEVMGHDVHPVLGLQDMFEAFDLARSADSYPAEASAGMRQRVAMIRTFLFGTEVFLLDEPFSNLDFDIKLRVQRFLIAFRQRTAATFLLVTHDIEDAIVLSDRIYVLSEKPTHVKSVIDVRARLASCDPIEARKLPAFRDLFAQIVDELKYLDAPQ